MPNWLNRVLAALAMGLPVGALAGGPLVLIGYFTNNFEPTFWPFLTFWMIGTIAAYVSMWVTGV